MGQALGYYKVEQSKVAMMEHFGKFVDVLEPRCHCLPWCLGNPIADRLALRIRQLNVKCDAITKDNVLVNVVASIHYRAVADKPSDSFYKLTNTKEQIKSYVFHVIRGSVPKLEFNSVFEKKNDIARAIEDELAKVMSKYGYEIVQTLITDIERDAKVKKARNAVARMKLAANEKAKATVKFYKKEYSNACTSRSRWF